MTFAATKLLARCSLGAVIGSAAVTATGYGCAETTLMFICVAGGMCSYCVGMSHGSGGRPATETLPPGVGEGVAGPGG